MTEGISFREDFRVWFPDYDHKPETCLALVNRDVNDMDAAIRLCKKREVCVQAGGHAGYWPLRLARFFVKVYSFECEPLLFECLKRNTEGVQNLVISPEALGAYAGDARLKSAASAGSWRIAPDGECIVRQIAIDDLCLPACDALFLDIEGYEVEALKGAARTIQRFRPVIHVEELERSRKAIQAHMASIRYRPVKRVHKDCVYVG